MVLEEWDDMVGEDWEAPEATFLNPSDWLESSPNEIVSNIFRALIDKAFDKCENWINKNFNEVLKNFWENERLDLNIFKHERLDNRKKKKLLKLGNYQKIIFFS